jgi:hypothetical protein
VAKKSLNKKSPERSDQFVEQAGLGNELMCTEVFHELHGMRV